MTDNSNSQPFLNEALDRLWAKFQPQMEERVVTLEAAAASYAAGDYAVEHREAASTAAHKLAGVLGTFGLTKGTILARELEIMYAREAGPDPELTRQIVTATAQLRAVVSSRK